MLLNQIEEEIRRYDAQGLELLARFIGQRSISASGEGIEDCARLVADTLSQFGFPAKIYQTAKYPIVYAQRLDAGPDALTIVYYGHYDTMPPDPVEDWDFDPFRMTLHEGRLYGRGTADNKGLFVAGFLGMRAYAAVADSLPVNIKIVLDGEEECGSPSIRRFIAENKEMLKADLVLNIDGGYYIDNPQILYGVRGNLVTELYLETATSNNHSGLRGNVIPEASYEMAKVLAALRDAEGRIAIPGFFDQVIPPTEKDLSLLDDIPYHPAQIAAACGVDTIPYTAREYFTRLMFEPTLTINGTSSGYLGKDVLMCIPGNAMAKISMRLVLDQDPDDVFKKFSDYVKSLAPNIQVKRLASCPPSRTPTDLKLGEVIQDSLTRVYGKKAIVIPSDGGTAPDYIWTKELGAPSLIAPLANDDCKSHAANENIRLDLFRKAQYAVAQIIYDLGRWKCGG